MQPPATPHTTVTSAYIVQCTHREGAYDSAPGWRAEESGSNTVKPQLLGNWGEGQSVQI